MVLHGGLEQGEKCQTGGWKNPSAHCVRCLQIHDLSALEKTLELEHLRFEAIPEGCCDNGRSHQTKTYDEEIAGDANMILVVEAGVEIAEIDEDEDVGHVHAVADLAVERQ